MQEDYKHLEEWLNENPPSKKNQELFDKFQQQLSLVTYDLPKMLGSDLGNFILEHLKVISTHKVKSLVLPVYQLLLPDWDTTITMSSDFHVWTVSVLAKKPITAEFDDLFNPAEMVSPNSCKGFPGVFCMRSFLVGDKKKFTVEFQSDARLLVFLWLMTRAK